MTTHPSAYGSNLSPVVSHEMPSKVSDHKMSGLSLGQLDAPEKSMSPQEKENPEDLLSIYSGHSEQWQECDDYLVLSDEEEMDIPYTESQSLLIPMEKLKTTGSVVDVLMELPSQKSIPQYDTKRISVTGYGGADDPC